MEKGKKVFLEAVTDIVNLLDDTVNWEKIDPANPAPAPEEPVTPDEKVIGAMTDNQKIIWSVLMQIKKEPHLAKTYMYINGIKAITLFNGVAQVQSQNMVWYNNAQLMDDGASLISNEVEYTTPLIKRLEVHISREESGGSVESN